MITIFQDCLVPKERKKKLCIILFFLLSIYEVSRVSIMEIFCVIAVFDEIFKIFDVLRFVYTIFWYTIVFFWGKTELKPNYKTTIHHKSKFQTG
jgi:hypothetical protein